MWRALRHPPFKGPVLLLYSYADQLADASRAAELARSLRLAGHPVLEQVRARACYDSHKNACWGAGSNA